MNTSGYHLVKLNLML